MARSLYTKNPGNGLSTAKSKILAMEITIELTAEAFDHIVPHVPKESSLYSAVRGAEVIVSDSPKFLIPCDQAALQTLFEITKEYCPDTVHQIEDQVLKSAQ